MPPLPPRTVCPGWPAEATDCGRHLRRFVVVSVLAHGLVLSVHWHFLPVAPVDHGIQPIAVRLAPFHRLPEPAPVALPAARNLAAHLPSRPLAPPMAAAESGADRARHTTPRADAQAMIELGKADIEAGSRRQMLDPMFAPAARSPAAATPLERATASRKPSIEQLAGQLVRVTSADGHRYCLQGLPEAATRDIPTPVLAIPMNCP